MRLQICHGVKRGGSVPRILGQPHLPFSALDVIGPATCKYTDSHALSNWIIWIYTKGRCALIPTEVRRCVSTLPPQLCPQHYKGRIRISKPTTGGKEIQTTFQPSTDQGERRGLQRGRDHPSDPLGERTVISQYGARSAVSQFVGS